MSLPAEPSGKKQMNTDLSSKVNFPNLDGLRFFCFLSVFLFHSFGTNLQSVKENGIYQFLNDVLFANGVLGVNFFFVLSGFLITYLLIVEKELFQRIKVGNFYIRRILRIWPLYFFCVIFGFVLFPLFKTMLGQVPAETANPWYYIFLVSNFDIIHNGTPDSSVLAILWSVAIEEQFYLVWPVLLFLFPQQRYLLVFGVMLIASFVFRLIHADSYIFLTLHTFSCISDMVTGGAFAWLAIYNRRFFDFVRRAPRWLWVCLYVTVGVIYVFTQHIFKFNSVLAASERLVISILFAFIIAEQCFAENSFYKMSGNKLLTKLGTYTFGLYCLHPIGMLIVNQALTYFGVNDNIYKIIFIEFPLALSTTIALAMASYHLYERRFLLFKDRFARIRKN